MKIDHTTEDSQGRTVTFRGELSNVELDFVIQTGLNFLLYNNLLPAMQQPAQEEVH